MPYTPDETAQSPEVLAQIELRRQMEIQVQRLNSLATTARAVTTLGSLDDVLRVICVQAQQLLSANLARIAAPVEGTNTIKYIMSTGSSVDGLMDLHFPIDASVCGSVLRSGQGRLIEDLRTAEDVYPAVKELSPARSVLYQPLQHQGAQLGVLIVGSDRSGSFDQADLDYLGRYAEYAAVAIANARLHAALQQSELEQQRQSRELAALLELSQAVNQSLDLDTVLSEGLRVLQELELATVSTVLLVSPATSAFELRAARGVPPAVLPSIQRSSLETISGDVLREGRLRVLSEDERQQMLDQYGIAGHFLHQTSVYIPLIVSEKRLGVLGVSRPEASPYAERELWLLQALANHLAQAAAKAQTHQALQETAALNARLYREAEEVRGYLNTLIHTTPDLLVTIRPDMTLHMLNPERLSATDTHYPNLIEGGSFLDIVPADQHADLLAHWQRILAGHPQSVEITGVKASGQPYSVLLSAALIPDYGEVFAIVKDVTEQRHNETQAHQNEQLAALGRMVAGAAHELNNPLAAILGLTQLQIASVVAPELRADLERIERSALRARSIVQQLLTFARVQRPEPQPVAIAALIHDVLERLASTVAQHQIQVTVAIDPNLAAARGDPNQLEQVLFNIIHNAMLALSSNLHGARRDLSIQATQQPDAVRISISDSGPGIAPQHLTRVFEPFFTTRPIGQGTGLGLAITHSIIQQHQGQIHVTSQAGQATTFTIDLPIANEQPSAPAPAPPPATPTIGAHILLVEDEELVRTVVTRTLVRNGYQVDAVDSGEAALALALAHDYALIISDLQMPTMDGPALYEELRDQRPSSRWLIMTGDTMGERSHSFLQRSRLPALAKPFTREQLLERVAECLAGDG
ncbi:MAG TPA: GAF domain-containing protein [Roseiflexaceae bacterium]|nr:GAF domain-containing protein [Roseiflexaceae bacterium]